MSVIKCIKFKSRQEWLDSRRLGGSSVSAILNASKHLSANELYDEIMYPVSKPDTQTEATERGNKLEPLIRKEFETLNQDFKVTAPPRNNWIFINSKYPKMSASLDGIIQNKETKEKGFLEIKTREVRSKREIEEWKNEKIPQNYFIQLMHYFLITEYEYCVLASHLIQRNFDTNKIEEVQVVYQWFYRKDYEKDIENLKKMELKFLDNCEKHIRPKAKITILGVSNENL